MQWTEASDAMDGKKQCNGRKEVMQWMERSGSGANASVLPQCHFMFFPVNSTDDTKKYMRNYFVLSTVICIFATE